MATTDLDPHSPLARFLADAGSAAERGASRGGPAVARPIDDVDAIRAGDDGDVRSTTADADGTRVDAVAARGVERRAALRSGLLGGRSAVAVAGVVVRRADAEDRAVRRLVARDPGAVPPTAPLLLAELDGTAVAAIGVLDRRVVADPAVDAAAAVDRLQARAAELRGPLRRARRRARRRRGDR